MQPSMFNLRVPLEARDEIFLMNTLTDAQLVVSSDVAALLDRASQGALSVSDEEREALELLRENGFLVNDRAEDPGCRISREAVGELGVVTIDGGKEADHSR